MVRAVSRRDAIPLSLRPRVFHGSDNVSIDVSQPLGPEVESVLLEPPKSTVLLLTQSCDIDNRNFISVARVLPFSSREEYAKIKAQKDKVKFIRNNYPRAAVRPAEFYLMDAQPNLPKSWASFLELHTIRKTSDNLDYLKRNRILQLNKEATEDLQFRIAYFFGRYAGITGDYMLGDGEKDPFVFLRWFSPNQSIRSNHSLYDSIPCVGGPGDLVVGITSNDNAQAHPEQSSIVIHQGAQQGTFIVDVPQATDRRVFITTRVNGFAQLWPLFITP
jgi:hypothetical protein